MDLGEMTSWVTANWAVLLTSALAVVGGASVAVKAIAPLTATKWDDKLSGWLTKVHGWMSVVALKKK